MNSIRILERAQDRSRDNNVLAQSHVLCDLLQREIDINRITRSIMIDQIILYEENLILLKQKGFVVTQESADSFLIRW